MKTLTLIAGVAALSLGATSVFAQSATTTTTVTQKKSGVEAGAASGAIGGAVIAGPVGAAVGAVGGAIVGAVVSPPSEVRTYVTTQNVPTVSYADPIVVGKPIAGEVTWLDVPQYPKYHWAYLNGQRVIIDADTHNVVAVYR